MKFTQGSLKTATACMNCFQGYSLRSLLLKNLSVKWGATDIYVLRLFSLNQNTLNTLQTDKQTFSHRILYMFPCCPFQYNEIHVVQRGFWWNASNFFLSHSVHTCAVSHKPMTYMIGIIVSFYFKDWRFLLWSTVPLTFFLWKMWCFCLHLVLLFCSSSPLAWM